MLAPPLCLAGEKNEDPSLHHMHLLFLVQQLLPNQDNSYVTCIAIIMYCQRLFLLVTGKQTILFTLKKIFRGTYLQRISVFMQNFKFGGVAVLAVQLLNKIKRKKKNLKKHVFLYFPHVMSKYIYIW